MISLILNLPYEKLEFFNKYLLYEKNVVHCNPVVLFDKHVGAEWKRVEVVPTERGAHTIALDMAGHRVYAFLPESHRASVFRDSA